jgi:hypothetical protein
MNSKSFELYPIIIFCLVMIDSSDCKVISVTRGREINGTGNAVQYTLNTIRFKKVRGKESGGSVLSFGNAGKFDANWGELSDCYLGW